MSSNASLAAFSPLTYVHPPLGEGRETVKITYAGLYDKVAVYASALRNLGVVTGDRVAGGYCVTVF